MFCSRGAVRRNNASTGLCSKITVTSSARDGLLAQLGTDAILPSMPPATWLAARGNVATDNSPSTIQPKGVTRTSRDTSARELDLEDRKHLAFRRCTCRFRALTS